jgi:hypothetical protein
MIRPRAALHIDELTLNALHAALRMLDLARNGVHALARALDNAADEVAGVLLRRLDGQIGTSSRQRGESDSTRGCVGDERGEPNHMVIDLEPLEVRTHPIGEN